MFNPKALTLSLAILTALFLAACQSAPPPFECTDAIGCVTIGPDEPIKLAVLETLTGEVGVVGTEHVDSYELAIAERVMLPRRWYHRRSENCGRSPGGGNFRDHLLRGSGTGGQDHERERVDHDLTLKHGPLPDRGGR